MKDPANTPNIHHLLWPSHLGWPPHSCRRPSVFWTRAATSTEDVAEVWRGFLAVIDHPVEKKRGEEQRRHSLECLCTPFRGSGNLEFNFGAKHSVSITAAKQDLDPIAKRSQNHRLSIGVFLNLDRMLARMRWMVCACLGASPSSKTSSTTRSLLTAETSGHLRYISRLLIQSIAAERLACLRQVWKSWMH